MGLGLSLGLSIRQRGGGLPYTTYYVDPAGSDANDGLTPATAWATIAKVNGRTYSEGEQILFKGGSSFVGAISLSGVTTGTASRPLIFGSYGTGKALITSGTSRGFYALNCPYVQVQDLNFQGAGTDTGTVDGVLFENTGTERLPGCAVRRCEVYDYGREGISWRAWGATYRGYDDPRVENCIVHDCTGNGGTATSGIAFNAADYSHTAYMRPYVYGCTVYNCKGDSAATGNWSGSGIFIAEATDGLIEYCVAYNNGADCMSSAGGPVGIWTADAKRVTIRYCVSYNNKTGNKDGSGFDIDGGAQDCVIEYCYSHGNMGYGYMLYQYSYSAANYLALSGNIVRHCISVDDGSGSAGASVLLGNHDDLLCPNNHFVHNTIVQTLSGKHGISILGTMDATRWSGVVANNIIRVTGASGRLISSGPSSVNITFEGNCYSGSSAIQWGGTAYASVSAWRTGASKEALGAQVVADPLLADTTIVTLSSFDASLLTGFKHSAGGPAQAAGVNIPSLYSISLGSVDFFGDPIPLNSRYSIGAAGGRTDAVAPTITSTAAQSVGTGSPFSMSLTASEPVTWSKVGGADQALFTLSGSTLSMTARDFASPTDADGNNTYLCSVRATDAAGNTADQTITVTVTGAVLWTPDAISSDLALWWDASDASKITLAGGTKVSAWTDKKIGHVASQATAANQPDYDGTSVNFTGSPHNLAFPAPPNGYLHRWIFMVIDCNDITSYAAADGSFFYVDGNSGSTNNRHPLIGYQKTGGLLEMQWRDATGYNSLTRTPGTDPILMTSRIVSGVHYAALNGNTEVSTGSAINPSSGSSSGLIGDFRAFSSNFSIRQIVVGFSTMTDDLRDRLVGWGAHKYGLTANLPSGHPYKSSAPTV